MSYLGKLCRELKDGQTICLSFEFFANQYELRWYYDGFTQQYYYHFGDLNIRSINQTQEYLQLEFKDRLLKERPTCIELKGINKKENSPTIIKMRLKTIAELREELIDKLLNN